MESSSVLPSKPMIRIKSVFWLTVKTQLICYQLESYSLLSRQSVSKEKPIVEIVLVPSIARALILSGMGLFVDREPTTNYSSSFLEHLVHFYTLPSLDPVPWNIIKPIRNVVTIAVDHQHLQRPPSIISDPPSAIPPIEFCVIKRSNIALYNLRDKLFYQKVPFSHSSRISISPRYM